MSGLGQKRTFTYLWPMSALPPKADILRPSVRKHGQGATRHPMTCLAESTLTRPTQDRAPEWRLRPNQEKAWHRPRRWPWQFYRVNCDIIADIVPPALFSAGDLTTSICLTDSTIRVGFVFSGNIIKRICGQFSLAVATSIGVAFPLGGYAQALAHENHDHFSAGQPGDPRKPSRTVKVSMLEEGKRMLFDPPAIEARLARRILRSYRRRFGG